MSRIQRSLETILREQTKIAERSREGVTRDRARVSTQAANQVRDAVACTEVSFEEFWAAYKVAAADGNISAKESKLITALFDAMKAAIRGE